VLWQHAAVVRRKIGLLEDNDETEGQPDWRRDPVGSRLSFAALRVRLQVVVLTTTWPVGVPDSTATSEAVGPGSITSVAVNTPARLTAELALVVSVAKCRLSEWPGPDYSSAEGR
jgi:hypothetical protein